ncbi:MAG: hypothetical protein IJU27_03190 [Bacteroidales bacterium]|nr:hypothetical protein [Bacteroidales bacterium]
MMRKWFHILIILPLLLAAGCQYRFEPESPVSGMVLTVRCDDPVLVKSAADGESKFNENLIKSVDFFFYPGENPAGDADAVYHHRVDVQEDTVTYIGGQWEATFNIVLTRVAAEEIFTAANNMRATVYAVVNYNGDLTPGGSLAGTSLSELADIAVTTDFAATESAYIQGSFLMDGSTVVTYDESAPVSASGTVEAKRFAAKMTTAISVANEVTLKHIGVDDPDEVWTPVLHTMRIYLVDGAKNVTLGTLTGAGNTSPEFFSYSAESSRRPFVKDNGTTYLNPTSAGGKTYYNTYPMYSYPLEWSYGKPDYSQPLPKQPYLKLEMDWRRTEANGYSYDRRKYYYKVILPANVNSLERNNWYHFNIDVAILGSETDEGKAVIEPTCYILDWQNKSVPIDKYAVISKARYLSVDTRPKSLNNLNTLSIPFLSSHDVKVVEGTVTARRPFYGEITNESQIVDKYNTTYHAWVRKDSSTGTYYLEYNGQDQSPDGQAKYEPSGWLSNTSTSIEFNHTLQNDYTKSDFDYSPYTIEFDIVHDDLTPGIYPYNEYLKHITIVQHPGIYIESCMNSDTAIKKKGSVYGYDQGSAPWWDMPWGYVYIDNGRFIRTGNNNTEPYQKLSTDNNKKEYQWRTVWYTGGGRDIFKINVTVLPSNSGFVIGDPRIDGYDTRKPVLGYSFVNNGNKDGDAVLPDRTGNPDSNFSSAPVVSGDLNTPMSLTGEERPLMYYRPTENSSRTQNMIAPSYRISTKLGGTEFGNLDESHAKYRCAAYQEDGFPAGRWRIPTMSEIKFIAQLSAKGVFEFMFRGDYWSANGVVNVNTTSGTVSASSNSSALLRCVYDSWYWGDEQWNPRTQFVWGDREP